uniref:DUF6273 domain-containing protein n=1 Tax=Olsenella timonensis TaxID=1805478 RepID=UPI00094E2D6A|nr:DUF6273 domain-containing protein [Olsenella timonensis]
MRCKKCGEELPESARFCYVCGAPVEEVPAPRRLEEPLDPLSAGAVPLVPLAPPPRAYTLEPRARRAAARGDLRSKLPSIRPQEPAVIQEPAPAQETADQAEGADLSEQTERFEQVEQVEQTGRPDAAEGAVEPRVEAADEGEKDAPAPAAELSEPTEPRPAPAADVAKTASDLLGKAGKGLASAGRQLRKGGRTVAEGFEGSRVPTFALVAGIAAVALVAVSALVLLGTSWLGPFAPDDAPAPVVQPPSDGSIPPLEADDEEKQEEEEDETLPEGAPETRDALGDYSWEELAQIAALVADASSDDEGVRIAADYNLCDADGRVDETQTKDLELSNGTTVPVAVAGVRSDERSDGSGVAGLTFVTRASLGKQAYNPEGGSVSWEDSPLRSWLNQSVAAELPEGLADLIVPVTKLSNDPAGSQCETSDSLWLLSYSELCGTPPSGRAAEGAQYRLFFDQGVNGLATSALVLADDYWWMRGASSDGSYQMTVTPEGDPNYARNPVYEFDVIAGFCL